MRWNTWQTISGQLNNRSNTANRNILVITHTDSSRVSIAIIRLCDSVCLSVCPHDKKQNG